MSNDTSVYNDSEARSECVYHCEHSDENPDFAWCERYRVNLDREGRFCRRCRSEPEFRRLLHRQHTARFGPECAGNRSYCEVFSLPTTREQCLRCAGDPLFRSFLRGQGQAGRAAVDWRSCQRRGGELRREERICCGEKTREISIFACAWRGEAQEADCCRCPQVAVLLHTDRQD